MASSGIFPSSMPSGSVQWPGTTLTLSNYRRISRPPPPGSLLPAKDVLAPCWVCASGASERERETERQKERRGRGMMILRLWRLHIDPLLDYANGRPLISDEWESAGGGKKHNGADGCPKAVRVGSLFMFCSGLRCAWWGNFRDPFCKVVIFFKWLLFNINNKFGVRWYGPEDNTICIVDW